MMLTFEKGRLLIQPHATKFGDTGIRLVLRVLCFLTLLSIGCAGSSQEHEHIVYHHKPTSFAAAVNRLDEIHAAMIGQGPLPSPRQFEDTDHHHHHAPSDENDHEHDLVEVDIFQECYDIVRWLPAIAGETDLPKKHWDKVNQMSKDLSKLVVDIEAIGKTRDHESLRKKFIENDKPIGRIIQSLKDMIPVHDEWEEKILKWQPENPRPSTTAMKGDLPNA